MDIAVKDLREKDCACDALILPVTEAGAKQYDYLGRPAGEAIKMAFSKKFSGKKNEVFLVARKRRKMSSNKSCRRFKA